MLKTDALFYFVISKSVEMLACFDILQKLDSYTVADATVRKRHQREDEILNSFYLHYTRISKAGLFTVALKPDSLVPDPRSGINVVLREFHTARSLRALHCWTGSQALSRSNVTQNIT